MTVEVANSVAEGISYPNGDLKSQNPSGTASARKSRESERRRRRRKQKKNKAAQHSTAADEDSDAAAEDANGATENDSAKENADPQKVISDALIIYFFIDLSVFRALHIWLLQDRV